MFSVRPPKKSWKNIANLSGGEKTLSSLALVFALHHYKPTPLYVMDEIDAALDFKNVSIVGTYLQERTKNAQFIVISLRNNMFELADRLVGIYKTYNITKTVTMNPQPLTQHMNELLLQVASAQGRENELRSYLQQQNHQRPAATQQRSQQQLAGTQEHPGLVDAVLSQVPSSQPGVVSSPGAHRRLSGEQEVAEVVVDLCDDESPQS